MARELDIFFLPEFCVIPPLTYWGFPGPYLVDEGGEAVVEALDLLLLVGPAHGQTGVDLQVQRGQQALVDGQRGQRGAQTVVTVGKEGAAAERHPTKASRPGPKAADPPGGTAAADGGAGADPLGAAQTHGDGGLDNSVCEETGEEQVSVGRPLWRLRCPGVLNGLWAESEELRVRKLWCQVNGTVEVL